jgi:hypothetical protein
MSKNESDELQIQFIEKHCKIGDPASSSPIPFILRDYQIDALKRLRRFDRNIFLTSRQLGMTSLLAAHIFWLARSAKDQKIFYVSHKSDFSEMFMKKIYKFAESLGIPGFVVSKTRFRIIFMNGSEIIVARDEEDFHSYRVTHTFIDNAAFIKNLTSILALPAVQAGKIVMTSSPCAPIGDFFNICENNHYLSKTFITTKYDWTVIESRDKKWLDDNTYKLSDTDIKREFLCQFS